MAEKSCENCYYGVIWEMREKLGIPCCVICLLRSNMLKGKFEICSKDNKCRKWRDENDA